MKPKYLVFLSVVLVLIHSQQPQVSKLTIAPNPVPAPCLECATGYTQLCVKIPPNCQSFKMSGECTLCSIGYTLVGDRCYRSIEDRRSLEGEYSVVEINGEPFSSSIKVVFGTDSVGVSGGCNTHSGQYTLESNGQIFIGPFIGTLRFCQNDPDIPVLGALNGPRIIARESFNEIALYDEDGNKLIKLRNNRRLESFAGSYTVSLPGRNIKPYNLEATRGSFLLSDECNSHSFLYEAADGVIVFGPILSTKKSCPPPDNDIEYLRALQKVKGYVRDSNGGFIFLDENSNTVLRGVNKNPPIFDPPADLSGEYFISIPNQQLQNPIELSVRDGRFTISGGCNTHFFSYRALSIARTITFGPIGSTRRFCPNDQDNVFLDAFRRATGFVRDSNGGFVLTYLNQSALVDATPQTIVIPPPPPPPLSPPQPTPQPLADSGEVVGQRDEEKEGQLKEEKEKYTGDIIGTYTIRLPNSGYHQDIRVEFAPLHIKLFGGCNFHTLRYHAYEDGEFSATLESSTERACEIDEDSIYIQAIESATKLQSNSNGFILSNAQGDAAFLKNTDAQQTSYERYLYSLKASFRQFEASFIVRVQDPILSRITFTLYDRYSHFLDDTRVIAGFRSYKINYLAYQVLFKAADKQDVFLGVMNYFPDTDQLLLRSLTLIDLTILPISNRGCLEMVDSLCRNCDEGYRLFRGRCHEVQDACLLYDPEECFICKEGYRLEKGGCIAK